MIHPVKQLSAASQSELKRLRELSARVGNDPLLTQASTGNSSAKLDGTLWIKASGKWMAEALRDDVFVPLDLADVRESLRRGVDPAARFSGASLETAMHAAMPHRVVLHVHSVNTIAWAVRQDAAAQLRSRLDGLRWQLLPYIASGLPLSCAIERALPDHPDTDVLVLGNHGLVIGGGSVEVVKSLLDEVRRRLAIPARRAHPADYAVMARICADSQWEIPDDDGVHALATDPTARAILAGGLLYPCQAIFAGTDIRGAYRVIPYLESLETQSSSRPFLLIENCGVVVNQSAGPAELAMLSGLAQVVQRLSASAPIRYLTVDEVAALSGQAAYRYRDLANASQHNSVRSPGSFYSYSAPSAGKSLQE